MEDTIMIFEKTAQILADYKGIETSGITPDTTLDQLELDSLDRVELIMSMEEAFHVQIDPATPIVCIRELVEIVEKQLAEKANA
jgi:acyl carrier protein